jgi:hypothetical protein
MEKDKRETIASDTEEACQGKWAGEDEDLLGAEQDRAGAAANPTG